MVQKSQRTTWKVFQKPRKQWGYLPNLNWWVYWISEPSTVQVSLGSTLKPVRVATQRLFIFTPGPWEDDPNWLHPQKTNSSHLKMDGWNTSFLWDGPFSDAMLVSGRVIFCKWVETTNSVAIYLKFLVSSMKKIFDPTFIWVDHWYFYITQALFFLSLAAQAYTSFKSWFDALNVLLLVTIGTAAMNQQPKQITYWPTVKAMWNWLLIGPWTLWRDVCNLCLHPN